MKKLLENIVSNKEKLIVLFDQGLVSGVNFVVGILLARILGLDEYGLFALAWMVVLFASSLHQAFVVLPLYTLLPKQENKRKYLSSLMAVQVGFSVITFCISMVAVTLTLQFFPEWNRPYIVLNLACTAALFVFNDYMRRLFFTLHRPFTTLVLDCIAYGLQPVIILTLHHANALSITTVFIAMNTILTVSILVAIFTKYSHGISFRTIHITLLKNWKFSQYLIGTAFLQWVSGNLFIVVAGGIIGPMAVGAIRIAQNIVGVLHVLFLAMENLVPIRASELLHQKGRIPMMQYVGKVSKQAALPTIGLLLIITLFRQPIIALLYGAEYLPFQTLLLAFCGLYVLVFIGTILRFVIITIENNSVIFISYVASSVFSLILAKPLVGHFGLTGVMIGLFSLQILTLSIYLFSLKNDIRWIFK
jgi:O-antigen/teichoic acid export membrane protein